MKKLLFISAILAAVTVGAFAADPLGIEVGTDVKIAGFETDLGVALRPFVAYKRTIGGIDTKATLNYQFPVYQDFLIDEGTIGVKGYGSKTFTLNETFTLTPGLTAYYAYDTAADEDQSYFEIDPEATLGYGKFYTLLQGIYAFVPDSAFDLYLEQGASFGAVSPYVYIDYAINPDAKLAQLGFGASYGFKAWTFLGDGYWTGFDDGEDVTYHLLLKVKYSF